jgi:hypothetical protein
VLPLWAQSLRLALAWIFISVQAAHGRLAGAVPPPLGSDVCLALPGMGLQCKK